VRVTFLNHDQVQRTCKNGKLRENEKEEVTDRAPSFLISKELNAIVL